MDYYFYKMNLQPNVLKNYSSEEDYKYLLNDVIVNALNLSLGVKEANPFYKICLEVDSKNNFEEKFEELESITNTLNESYEEIVKDFHQTGEINYSKEFLRLNAKASKLRNSLEYEYPELEEVYDEISNEKIEKKYNLNLINQVGTAIFHLRRFYKLKDYISNRNNDIDNQTIDDMYYNPKNEQILVKSSNAIKAENSIKKLINELNKNKIFTEHVGKVSINPVYEDIVIKGNVTEITYVLVYPNGNAPFERHNILEETEGLEQKVTITGNNDNPLNAPVIEQFINKEGEKGYLKEVSIKKGNKKFKIESLIKVVHDIFND
ncbi:hypothetical protein [Carnobacterium inhibens]|uniref:hypothetical protein n=1 Tax=Carnobacterium inhibens TaxID=147709 RepID=UPI00203BEE46|nr:hypothetical protein [Carnobacterium inhibens]MCM3511628.1 hypothetical protein [Carnobacterium inhibens]